MTATANAAPTDTDLVLTDYGTRERWLAAREHGIGASESAALFGVSPYDTVTSLWAKKTGLVADDFGSESKLLKWGKRLEAPIAEGYQEDSGRRLWRASPFAIAQHPDIPFMLATPDYFIVEAPDRTGQGLAEIKNVGVWQTRNWEDGPPSHIVIQAQHQMSVTGRDFVTVVPLIGGNDDRPIDIERNPVFIDELEEQIRWFQGFVERREQPPIDGSERTLETLKKLHPKDNGATVTLPEEAAGWWESLVKYRAMESEARKGKPQVEALLFGAFGDATFGVLTDGTRLSLRTQDRDGHVVDPYSFRSLRVEKDKPKGKGGK